MFWRLPNVTEQLKTLKAEHIRLVNGQIIERGRHMASIWVSAWNNHLFKKHTVHVLFCSVLVGYTCTYMYSQDDQNGL